MGKLIILSITEPKEILPLINPIPNFKYSGLRWGLLGLLITFPLWLFSQQKSEIGFTAGTAVYLGDNNPENVFYSIRPSFGVLQIHNFNKRFALRTQLSYVDLAGSKNLTFFGTGNRNFNTSIVDFSSRFEINFKPFKLTDRKHPVSPYVNGGLGIGFLLQSAGGSKLQLMMPFGGGVKIGVSRRMCVGIEYGIRKSFTDHLDNSENNIYKVSPQKSHPFINNDWYHITGLFFTFNLFDNPGDCPVYDQK